MQVPRPLLSVVLPMVLLVGVFAAPPPARACSCVAPEPMAAYRGDPLKLVFTGTVARADQAAVDIAVERWFQGPGGALVRFPGQTFGDQSAACQAPLPPVTSRWIYVAFIPEPGGRPQVNACTPHAQLGTPEGNAMLNDAMTAFGGGAPITNTPAPRVEPGSGPGPAAVVAGVALVSVLLFGSVVFLARRPRGGS